MIELLSSKIDVITQTVKDKKGNPVSLKDVFSKTVYIQENLFNHKYSFYFVDDSYSFDDYVENSKITDLFKASLSYNNTEILKGHVQRVTALFHSNGIQDINNVLQEYISDYNYLSVRGDKIIYLDKHMYTALYKASNDIPTNYFFNGSLLNTEEDVNKYFGRVIIEDVSDVDYFAESWEGKEQDNGVEKDVYCYFIRFKNGESIHTSTKFKPKFEYIRNLIKTRSSVPQVRISRVEMQVSRNLDVLNIQRRCNWCGKELGGEKQCPVCHRNLYYDEEDGELQRKILLRLGVDKINDLKIDQKFVVCSTSDEGEIQAQYIWSPQLSYFVMRNCALDDGRFEESIAFYDDIKYVMLEADYSSGIKRERPVIHFKDSERFSPLRFDHVYWNQDHHLNFLVYDLKKFDADDFDYININVRTKAYEDAITHHYVHLHELYKTKSYDIYKKEVDSELEALRKKRAEEEKSKAPVQPVQPVQPAPAQTPANNGTNKFEEIKKFKELLDMGIITQEEFDQKKKEILGM